MISFDNIQRWISDLREIADTLEAEMAKKPVPPGQAKKNLADELKEISEYEIETDLDVGEAGLLTIRHEAKADGTTIGRASFEFPELPAEVVALWVESATERGLIGTHQAQTFRGVLNYWTRSIKAFAKINRESHKMLNKMVAADEAIPDETAEDPV